MNNHARRLGMSQTHYVNPNGLPAESQITSARDLAILARALIREFPEYDHYWHISAIRFGKRVMRNYNSLIDRYPGADGMKTGFICASGYNVVASATRNGKRLIVVVLGAYGGGVRAQKAAQLLERGFSAGNLSWLTPSLGTVDALAPINAQPPNLRDEICGKHRRKPAAEDNEEEDETIATSNTGAESGDGNDTQQAFMLSALKPQNGKYVLGGAVDSAPPVEVYLGPMRRPGAAQTAEPKSKAAGKTAAAKPGQIAAPAPAAAPGQWNSLAPSSLANSAPANFATETPASVPMPRAKPKQQSAKQ
jgi:D-alanyl-D-alanine carboxypeptidase